MGWHHLEPCRQAAAQVGAERPEHAPDISDMSMQIGACHSEAPMEVSTTLYGKGNCTPLPGEPCAIAYDCIDLHARYERAAHTDEATYDGSRTLLTDEWQC